jgi:hypothetical protein
LKEKRLPVCENIAFKAMKNKNVYMFKKTKAEFVAEVLDQINDSFLANVNKISNRTDILSSTKQLSDKQIEAISSASTTLAFFNQSIVANMKFSMD